MSDEKLTLENFRNEMDERALERGWFYFSKGWVHAPKEVLPGFFESVVNEVNPHAVSYSIDEMDHVDDVFCTCGDSLAPWCRHLAAVLFYIEDERRESISPDEHITPI
jgi:uncharacterized Zn finger protein